MIIPIFAKEGMRKSDGGKFHSYLSSLTRKDGTTVKVSVHFRKECGVPNPNKCPMMIYFDKKNANFVTREFDRTIETDNGTETKHIVEHRLWLSAWDEAGEYVDTSMNDFAESPDDVETETETETESETE